MKEFCLLKEISSRAGGDFTEEWINSDVPMMLPTHQIYSAFIRNFISSPIDGFAKGVYTGIAEFTRHDVPSDSGFRYSPAFDGLDQGRSVSFLAKEHVIREGRGPVKFMSLLRRKPGLQSEEFSRAWRTTHADLVRSVSEVWNNFLGYRQNHVIPDTCFHLDGSAMEKPYDGIVEIWFASLDALERTMMSQRYRDVIRPDEETFVDLPNTRLFAEEMIVFSREA